ncbi:MAG: DUF123 domain-containing protein [Halapricum sp.]
MTNGTYTLLIDLPEPATITFGAAGERDLRTGVYAYTGSAFGPGGFARVDRHRRIATGEHDARHWHVDYILGHPETRIVEVVRSAGDDIECAVAESLPGEPAPGIGASDCDCESHLLYGGEHVTFAEEVRRTHERVR